MEAHCKTMATKTRAELIALLKSRGIKGRLSKMTKAQLLAKPKGQWDSRHLPPSSSDPPARRGRAPCGIASSPRVASIETTLAPQLAPTQKLAWHEGVPKGLGHLWDSRGQPMLDQ